MDWAAEVLETSEPVEFIGQTLQLATRSAYLEAPEGNRLVAAAAVIAVGCGATPRGFPEGLHERLRGKETNLKPFVPAALLALRRVRSEDSELRDLWQESEDFSAWSEGLDVISKAVS